MNFCTINTTSSSQVDVISYYGLQLDYVPLPQLLAASLILLTAHDIKDRFFVVPIVPRNCGNLHKGMHNILTTGFTISCVKQSKV